MDETEKSYGRVCSAAGALGCAIERIDQFTAENENTMVSQEVRGRLRCSGLEDGNTVWRGFGSAASKSRISFSGRNNTVFLGAFSKLRKTDIRFIGDNCLFFFGPLSTVASMVSIVRGGKSVLVGSECMFSSGISMDTSDHHGIYCSETGGRINLDADITISSRVWLGRDVTVSKGAHVGSDAVIGAWSFVTGEAAGNSIHAGTPAKLLRSGVVWSRGAADHLEQADDTEIMQSFLKKRRRYARRLNAA